MNNGSNKHIVNSVVGGMKGMLANIPYIGGTIIGAWDGYWNSRLQETIDLLSEKINALEEEKIDTEYVSTEEFIDLIHKALKIRVQSRSRTKANFIYGMLLESIQTSRDETYSADLKESFLNLLDQLTEDEMIFLYEFSKGTYFRKTKKDIYPMGDHLAIAIDGLFAKGILQERDTFDKQITQSMLGREFIEYIKKIADHDVKESK